MQFSVTILGCNSALPTIEGNPSAQLITHNNSYFLVDCGEGTQKKMQQLKLKSHRINHIFISHLHGDHYLGLMGLLFSYHLTGREHELHLFAPKELEEIINLHLSVGNSQLNYPLVFHKLETSHQGIIYSNNFLEVSSFNLNHRIDTFGFLFKEKQKGKNIKKEAISEYNLSHDDIKSIKMGRDVADNNGKIIDTTLITLPESSPRAYAYCSDTVYHEDVIPFIQGADLLYHEATFEENLKEKAKERFHSTAMEAATIALKSHVKRLLIGHFSARYTSVDLLVEEACSIFENSAAAEEGMTYQIL
ncbi:MAG: ribonuclease Z [Bacteroidales bacterium]|nr:ribonuclease Z [Bacteroidales bacterium]